MHKLPLAWLGLVAAMIAAGCDAPREAAGPTNFGSLPAFFDCVGENGIVLSGHRAAPGPGLAENALPTLAAGAADGLVLFEIDIRTTRDGKLVLFHDETLERTTTGTGRLSDFDFKALGNIRLKDPQNRTIDAPIPLLEEALAWSLGRAILQLDIKRGTDYRGVIDAIEKTGAQQNIVLIAYTAAQARKLASLAPWAMISVSIETLSDLEETLSGTLDPEKLLAFTGINEPKKPLLTALQNAAIESIVPTFGRTYDLDQEFEKTGDIGAYLALAKKGAVIIASDQAPGLARKMKLDDETIAACTVSN